VESVRCPVPRRQARYHLGRIHAGKVVTVHVAAEVITIDLGGEDTAPCGGPRARLSAASRPTGLAGRHVSYATWKSTPWS